MNKAPRGAGRERDRQKAQEEKVFFSDLNYSKLTDSNNCVLFVVLLSRVFLVVIRPSPSVLCLLRVALPPACRRFATC
jgi:hypothetical protein